MEQPSNSSHMEQSAFAPHPNALSNNQVDHLPTSLSFTNTGYMRDALVRERHSYTADGYPKDAFVREGNYVRDTYSKEGFPRDSFSTDPVSSYSEEAFSRERESLSKDGETFLPRPVGAAAIVAASGGDSRVPSFSRDTGDNCLTAGVPFPKDKDCPSDERSSKKVKRERGGWWHEEGAGERLGDTTSKDMDSTDAKDVEVGGAFVGVGGFRGVAVTSRALSIVGSSTIIEGNAGDAVGVVRGASADGGDGIVGGDIGGDGGGSTGGIDGELGDDVDVEGRDGDSRCDKGDKDGMGKKKRAELWQDTEMDALVGAYRQIHMKLSVAGKKGKHVFKSANEKWREVRNLLLPLGVDRQPKEIERKWSNLSTAFKQIADWNKKVGRPSYWDLDEVSKKEKTKAKELPATFRVQLYEAMAEFLGDRTASRRSRGWTQYDLPERVHSLLAGAGNGGSGGSETSGVLDIPLPMDKLSTHQSSTDVLDQKRLRIVLVATGSYNPPTYMHLRMFELARDALIGEGYDVLGGYMSPVNDAYGKKGLASADHRITLCQLATSDSSFVMVDPWEAKQANYQRTLTVLTRVDHAVNSHGFANEVNAEKVRVMLLCGADLLESFIAPGVWIPDQVQSLCHDHGVVCIQRDGKDVRKFIFENDLLYENRRNVIVVDEQITNNISSSKLRQNLNRGLSVKYLTTDSVINHIKTNHLYETNTM